MELITIIFIGLALSMDTFAVSVASGIALKQMRVRHAVKIALFFGGFQALMLFIGWLAGAGLKTFISAFDHWIAFSILSFVGGKMIYESLKLEKLERAANGEHSRTIDPSNIYYLLFFSVSTSLDALAVGFSFILLKISIATPVIIIGIITFLVALAGVYIGDRVGHFFEKKVALAAGLILIIIGIKILLEHLR